MGPRLQNDLFAELALGSLRRNLRLASGLVLFTYITTHLANHALGLVSLDEAETGLRFAITVWHSWPGTVLLYGAAATHFLLALWAVYERRTFLLPPAELLRIALGFWLPVLLIGHDAATRIAYELFGNPSDYSHVVANLWVSDSQGRQLGLLAPGWIHGCLGLHFAFNRRPLYIRLRFVLFGAALLLPVLSALGFITMGREVIASPAAAAAAFDYLSPAHTAERIAIAQWRDGLLAVYFAIVGASFGARAIRNGLEHSRKRLISISYPRRTVRVPRGWTVLEASRAFHIPHASMCGGRARCSTCRVRVTAGKDLCPPAQMDEQAILDRIGATPDIRLACQLRPAGDISVVPLVQSKRPIYRPTAPQRSAEREIVVLYCDFLNYRALATNLPPQDTLYVLMLHVEALGDAIRAAGGTLSSIELDSICALFGSQCGLKQAAQQALQVALAIEKTVAGISERLSRNRVPNMDIAVSIHAGHAVVGEIGPSERPVVMAVGEAMDAANELRRAAAQSALHGKPFAITKAVYTAADVDPGPADETVLESSAFSGSTAVFLSTSAPALPPSLPPLSDKNWRAALQRLWTG
jgi:adenylate cyclase